MAISEQKRHSKKGESDADTYDSYDSEEDPRFDILEEPQACFSKLSIKKKAKSRSSISKEMDADEEDPELIVPELDKKDEKCYETVQQIIEVGQIDKLKVDQCKLYLRKNGLRLTGNKVTLIGRIKEHLDITNGGGEKKYPASSFIVNCKGDACTGDVVMFEQNVYEMFNIASRSANGPPCGTRIVAGRIVKESYGAAKQQHTFTIEVLWSKGEKPLPSLHPLLIKGRNLYKLKTTRQRWQDEGERQKILLEKHTRGSVARLNRDTRIQEKEMRKMLKANRVKTGYQRQKMRENTSKEQQDLHPTFQFLPINIGKERLQSDMQKTNQVENVQHKEFWHSKAPSEAPYGGTSFFSNANVPRQRVCQRQPLTTMNYNFHSYQQNFNSTFSKSSLETHSQEQNMNSNQFAVQFPQESTIFNHLKGPVGNHVYQESTRSSLTRSPFQRQMNEPKQLCGYYARGRCYHGDQCKQLHEVRERGGRPSGRSYYY